MTLVVQATDPVPYFLQGDGEMAARARLASADAGDDWERLLAEGAAYIAMALDPEVRQIVLIDGPAFLGDPSHWPSQNACLQATKEAVARLIADGVMKSVDACRSSSPPTTTCAPATASA